MGDWDDGSGGGRWIGLLWGRGGGGLEIVNVDKTC